MPATTSPNRLTGFILGFLGFVVFAGAAAMVVTINRGKGGEFDNALAQQRRQWAAEARDAQAIIRETAWKDEAAGLARVEANAYLPIAARHLLAPKFQPRPMSGDSFIVPGTKTFDEMAARQAAAAAAAAAAESEDQPEPEQPDSEP